jgi:uncharacterized protein
VHLTGRTALVSGASGGLGAAIARGLAARGARVVVTARRAEAIDALATAIGGRAVPADLSDAAAVDGLLDEVGQVDVLVANAALPGSGRLETYDVDQIDRALDVNLRAPIVMAHRLLPAMTARGSGQLVFVASLSARVPAASASMYTATKFGIRGFALALREDLHGTGVGVSLVHPAFISEAGMFHDVGVDLPRAVGLRPPGAVAEAVVRAVERNRAETFVGPPSLRLGAALAGVVSPDLITRVNRLLGVHRYAERFAAAQRDKR